MNEKKLNYEEFMRMMLDCEIAFRDVMEVCGPENKRAAIKGINTLKQMVKEHVETFQEKNKISFKVVEKALQSHEHPFGEEIKEEFLKIRGEIEPLLLQTRLKKENARSKKARKRKMENRIRVKE